MKKFLLFLATFCCIALHAQDNFYLIKGKNVISVFPISYVDSIKFYPQSENGTQKYFLNIVGNEQVLNQYTVTDVDSLVFTPSKTNNTQLYNITCTSSNYAEITTLPYAVSGQEVVVSVKVKSEKYRSESLSVNENAATYVSNDGTTWYYIFTMPNSDVNLTVTAELDRHTITPTADEHAYITMLNCCDNWDLPEEERIYDEVAEGSVKFYWGADNGYEASISASTGLGDELEVYYTDDDDDFGKCYYVIMPDEPIYIHVSATELTTYKDMAFTGEYKGYALKVGTNQLYTNDSPEFFMQLYGNTSYTATSTDENAFNISGCYTYNDNTKKFCYVEPRTDQGFDDKGFGVSGQYFDNGDSFVFVSNLDDDKPDNTRFYFSSQKDFTYSCAATNTYGTRYLVELNRSEGETWYFVNTQAYTAIPVTLQFSQGNSIANDSKAIAYDGNGDALFSYTISTENEVPTFVFVGNEVGTYTQQGGSTSSNTLILDGFGNATYGTSQGTYSISNGIVTFTCNGQEINFSIDNDSYTYTLITSSEWDGPTKFMGMSTEACYDSTNPTIGTVSIILNQNYAGKEEQGKAKVEVIIVDTYYTNQTTNGSTCTYAYDATNSTLLISGLLVGTADGKSSEHIELEFSVSSDKQTLTCTSPQYLRSTSGGNTRYIPLTNFTLSAKE